MLLQSYQLHSDQCVFEMVWTDDREASNSMSSDPPSSVFMSCHSDSLSITKSVLVIQCLLTKRTYYSSFFIEGIEKLSLIIGSGISFFSSPICFSVATTSLSTVVIFTKLIPCRHNDNNHADEAN